MSCFLAALALACALVITTPALPSEPNTQIAQMSRDVTDAVRKQREEQRERSRADERQRRGSKR